MAISRLPGTRRLIIGSDIKPDEIDTGHLKDGAVTTPKIGDGAVTTVKIGDDQVTGPKIGPEAIDGYTHDHISHDWEKTGTVTNIPVWTPGWQRQVAAFAEAFPTSIDLILHSFKATVSGFPPSALKIFAYASGMSGPSGIAFHIDVNISAAPSAYLDLDWLSRGH